ncbi:hypothetical protein KKA69_01770 [Patescibacteria group bacterium]|nr:hypothetical protein [Patescibacteria group bacterium]
MWKYKHKRFKNHVGAFGKGPPVFLKNKAQNNVIVKEKRDEVLATMPKEERHKWFRSMKSSQALTQSVFGNLIVLKKLELLKNIKRNNKPLFFDGHKKVTLEYKVDYLKEERSTRVDVFFDGPHGVAVECKLTEREIGPCSTGVKKEHGCDGSYSEDTCWKTKNGVQYWKHVPELFRWTKQEYYEECPLLLNYQLIRNVLAACVKDGKASPKNGHAVLLYDESNPEFQECGKARKSFNDVRSHLKPGCGQILQECTWQEVMKALREGSELNWLTDEIYEKYGIK